MGITTGKRGVLAVGVGGTDEVAELRNWSINEDGGLEDTSVMGDDWTKSDPVLKSWKGSCGGFWDATDTAGQGALVIGAQVTLTLFPGGNTSGLKKWSGLATVASVDTEAAHNGHVAFKVNFEGYGALTKSTVT